MLTGGANPAAEKPRAAQERAGAPKGDEVVGESGDGEQGGEGGDEWSRTSARRPSFSQDGHVQRRLGEPACLADAIERAAQR